MEYCPFDTSTELSNHRLRERRIIKFLNFQIFKLSNFIIFVV